MSIPSKSDAVPNDVVRTVGLTKHFGQVHAVEDLDFVIERGEVFGYLGPNGSGKSTSVRLLLDFLRSPGVMPSC